MAAVELFCEDCRAWPVTVDARYEANRIVEAGQIRGYGPLKFRRTVGGRLPGRGLAGVSRTRRRLSLPGRKKFRLHCTGRPSAETARSRYMVSVSIVWPPQLAASQISAAARIATKNTTTMTAAGIVRSLWSCLCTSVPLEVDGAGRGAAGKPGAAALAAFGCPGQRLPLPNLRLSDPALRPEPSGERSRRPDRSGLSYRAARLAGSWQRGLLPPGLLVAGSGRRGMGHPGSSPVR
jgi:hypothetical protein